MEGFWFRVKWGLCILGGYFAGLILVLFLEKVARLPFYAWQEQVIGFVGAFFGGYLFGKKVDKESK